MRDADRADARPDRIARESTERCARARAAWRLTMAQTRVLELVARGKTNKEIACALEIEEGTVEAHVGVIFRKAGATNRAMLVFRFWTFSI
jgi:DNA-binding NarL/FixJ family response regulator